MPATAPPRTPAGTPTTPPAGTPAAPAQLNSAIVELLQTHGLIDQAEADRLGDLDDTPPDEITALIDRLGDHVTNLVGDPEDSGDDGEPLAASGRQVTDDDLVLAEGCADAADYLRAHLTARHSRRTAALARVRGQQPAQPAPGQPRRPPVRRGALPPPPSGTGGALQATVTTAGGRQLTSDADLVAELGEALRGGPAMLAQPGRRLIASGRVAFPEARTLGRDADVNRRRVADTLAPDVLTAAGGLCTSPAISWAVQVLGSSARPVRDALNRFGADRGGITYHPPPELADLDDGTGIWTEAMDRDAADNDGTGTDVVKNCVRLLCPTAETVLVHAVTACLVMGTWQQRFSPEWVAASTQTLQAAHARLAESTLLADMTSGSTAVTWAETLSATRDLLAAIDAIVAGQRARLRMAETQQTRIILPSWVIQVAATDLARELPGATDERLASTRSDIERFLAARQASVTWSLDYSIAWSAVQAAGAVVVPPKSVPALVYPEGSWSFLDGGSLDVGLLRDSALQAVNDVQLFSESFEGVALTSGESLAVTLQLNPTGATSSTTDLTP